LVLLSRIHLEEGFLCHVLTDMEREEYNEIQNERRKIEYVGAHFAAKEAIYKATGEEDYLKYSILHEKNGKPYVKDHSNIHISISHDGEYAIAIAMVLDSYK